MKVFKFGGASVKDAPSVRNVASILKDYQDDRLIIVVSAMGKTTNALEEVVSAYCNKSVHLVDLLEVIKSYHLQIMHELFTNKQDVVFAQVNNLFVEIEWVLEEDPARAQSFIYDQIVSFGELIATRIVSAFLIQAGINNSWLDARSCILTDNTYREAKVDWEQSTGLIANHTKRLFARFPVIVTQGFIGSSSENYSTTLGREGSDYSAAIFAFALDAECMMIWKDVPGMMNADPKYFNDAQLLESLSSHDAIELAYYGASVIHPKTLKPLENKNIPLFVRSFLKPHSKGTVINRDLQTKPKIPSFIFKVNQVLVSISAKDFSFIAEDNLAVIFGIFARAGVKINLMQNSALSFSVCMDHDEIKIPLIMTELQMEFKVLYNKDLELYTVRNYFQSTLDRLSEGKEILVEQRSRNTAQLVMRARKSNS